MLAAVLHAEDEYRRTDHPCALKLNRGTAAQIFLTHCRISKEKPNGMAGDIIPA